MIRKVVRMGAVAGIVLGAFSIGGIQGVDLNSQELGKVAQAENQMETSEFVVDDQGVLVRYSGDEEEIKLPKSIKTISFGAFLDKSKIKKIVLPEGLKRIDEYAFYSCTSLEEVVIPDSVESIGRLAFGNCSSCKKVYLGKNLKEIEEFAFGICESLEKIEVSDSNLNYSGKDGILYDKDQKVLKLCPSNIKGPISIPSTVEVIGEYAFTACKKLRSVFRPNGSPLSIEDAAFYGCEALTDLDIRGGIEKIGSCAFAECKSLEKFKVGEKVKSVGSSAFMKCVALRKISFHSKETTLGHNLFVSCPQVIKVKSGGNLNVQEYVKKHSSRLVLK